MLINKDRWFYITFESRTCLRVESAFCFQLFFVDFSLSFRLWVIYWTPSHPLNCIIPIEWVCLTPALKILSNLVGRQSIPVMNFQMHQPWIRHLLYTISFQFSICVSFFLFQVCEYVDFFHIVRQPVDWH